MIKVTFDESISYKLGEIGEEKEISAIVNWNYDKIDYNDKGARDLYHEAFNIRF